MANMHMDSNPFQRNLFGIPEEEIENKFPGWKDEAVYTVESTIVVQIDTTNVSEQEYSVAPNIHFLSTNQAIVNIYKIKTFHGSLQEFQEWYAGQETSLEYYINDLMQRLNSARSSSGLSGTWYINYSLNDRHVSVKKV